MDELSDEDKLTVRRAKERFSVFFPNHSALRKSLQVFPEFMCRSVKRYAALPRLLTVKPMNFPKVPFFNVGTIDDVRKKRSRFPANSKDR